MSTGKWFIAVGLGIQIGCLTGAAYRLWSRPQPVEDIYAFDIPLLFPSCMHYEIPAFESFGNFNIHQPMTFKLNSGSQFHDSRIEVYNWCTAEGIDL